MEDVGDTKPGRDKGTPVPITDDSHVLSLCPDCRDHVGMEFLNSASVSPSVGPKADLATPHPGWHLPK